MPVLSEDQYKALILTAVGDADQNVIDDDILWPAIWDMRANLDDADPSGNLRYLAVLRDALDLVLGPATTDVDTSDGGGQSGSWAQHFDHLHTLRQETDTKFEALLKQTATAGGVAIDVMSNYTLTPVLPGFVDPASPAFIGDPRYRYARGIRLNGGGA